MNVTAIICDLDGTLIDSRAGIQAAIAGACKEVLPDGVVPDVEFVIGPPIRPMLQSMLPTADWPTIEALARAYRRHYDSTDCLSYQPYPGVKDTLAQLAAMGVSLFVLTNKPMIPTQTILTDLGVATMFRGVVCIDSRQPPFASKTESATHLKTQFHLDDASTILIGDGVDDAEAADACGFRFVAATYGYGKHWNSDETRPYTVATFAGLLALVERTGNAR